MKRCKAKNKFFLVSTIIVAIVAIFIFLWISGFEMPCIQTGLVWLTANLMAGFEVLKSFSPSKDFLSDIAAFEAMVIALAIPLSLQLISRISDRYNSDIVSKYFSQERETKILPWILIVNIIVIIALKFFPVESQSPGIWQLLTWIIFLCFVVISFTLVGFINKLIAYITSTETILNKLFKNVEKVLK